MCTQHTGHMHQVKVLENGRIGLKRLDLMHGHGLKRLGLMHGHGLKRRRRGY